MKPRTPKPPTAPAAATPEKPAFDPKTAVAIDPPRRHEKTARTVGWAMPASPGDGDQGAGLFHLFSVTRVFVATDVIPDLEVDPITEPAATPEAPAVAAPTEPAAPAATN